MKIGIRCNMITKTAKPCKVDAVIEVNGIVGTGYVLKGCYCRALRAGRYVVLPRRYIRTR